MIMMNNEMNLSEVPIYTVKDINAYWERLYRNAEYMLGNLRGKHEYGTSQLCSEKGIQRSCSYYAKKLVRKNGANVYKAGAICRLVGLCFPKFGSYGFEAVLRYFDDLGLYFIPENIKIHSIEWNLNKSGGVVTPELHKALQDYFNDNVNDEEVKIARACQKKIAQSRELMKQGVRVGDAIDQIMKPFIDEYTSEQPYYIFYERTADLPDAVKESVYKDLQEWIDYDGKDQVDVIVSEYIV